MEKAKEELRILALQIPKIGQGTNSCKRVDFSSALQ